MLATVTVDAIAAGGDGVGRADGLVVFVPRSAPGDEAEVALTTSGRFARGRIVELRRPSPVRTEPRCLHYVRDDCGGCQLQHVTYDAQLAAKRTIVADAIERIGKRRVAAVELVPSPKAWAYRTKLTLTVRDTLPRDSGAFKRIMGLRRYDDPDAVFDLDECPITEPGIVAAVREVRQALELLPPARTLSLSVRQDGDALVLVLNGGHDWPRAREFARACPSLAVVRWHPHGGGVYVVHDRRGGGAPAASFEQINPATAAAMRAHLVERALLHAPRTVVDAYAGTGATAKALHDTGVRVTAIELDAEAAAFTATMLRPPSAVVAARVEDAINTALPADVVIVNPPRPGLAREVTDALRDAPAPPRALLYVSCNPATLARDIGRLPNYRIEHVRAYDMFPQTAHVETLCELRPEWS